MTKRQLIDEILAVNRSAEPAFLAQFGDQQLEEYLQHLRTALSPRPLEARQCPGRPAEPAVGAARAAVMPEPAAVAPTATLQAEPPAERWAAPAGARHPATPLPHAPASTEADRPPAPAATERPDRSDAQPAGETNTPPDESNRPPFATSDEEMPAWLF
jgi:hypothetical protein